MLEALRTGSVILIQVASSAEPARFQAGRSSAFQAQDSSKGQELYLGRLSSKFELIDGEPLTADFWTARLLIVHAACYTSRREASTAARKSCPAARSKYCSLKGEEISRLVLRSQFPLRECGCRPYFV